VGKTYADSVLSQAAEAAKPNLLKSLQWFTRSVNAVGEAVVRRTRDELKLRLRLDRSTALYIYKAKNCKLLVLFTRAQKTIFIFK
jgi:hypothetical protein